MTLIALALVSTPLVVPPPSKRAKLSPPAAAPTMQLSTACAKRSQLKAGTVRTQKALLKKMDRDYFNTYEPDIEAYFTYRLDPTNEKQALAKEHVHVAVCSAKTKQQAAGRIAGRIKQAAATKVAAEMTAKKAVKKARRSMRMQADLEAVAVEGTRERKPRFAKQVLMGGGTVQVVHGDDSRHTWRWEHLPRHMIGEIEERLNYELGLAGGLSESELKLIGKANIKFDQIVDNDGIDPGTGENVLGIFLEKQWRADQGHMANGQDCCHIIGHSNGGAFCKLNYYGLGSHFNRFQGSDHDLLCIYCVGIYRAQLAFRASRYHSDLRQSTGKFKCPRGSTCECSSWEKGRGASMQVPFRPPFTDVQEYYTLGRKEMNKLRPECHKRMEDIRGLGYLQSHKK